MAKSNIELSENKKVILKTIYFLGVENILVRENDGAIIVTRSVRGSLNGTVLGRMKPEDEIDKDYLFPEFIQLENRSCLKLSELIADYC